MTPVRKKVYDQVWDQAWSQAWNRFSDEVCYQIRDIIKSEI